MSTTHSPNPSQNNVPAFKDDAHSDAVLPSSPEEEQLTPIPTTRSTSSSNIFSRSGNIASYGRDTSPYSTEDTSTHDQEQSDLQFMGINEFEPPDFSNNYLMEAKFGDFPATEVGYPAYFRRSNSGQQEEPMSATSTTSRSANTISRKSTGLATMSSSQLMSPQLTDAASPPSGFGDDSSPTTHHRLLGGGDATRTSSEATPPNVPHNFLIQTPAATGSSVDASPNLDQSQGRFPAPRVQVESYSRGDSPARAGNVFGQTSTRGRRGSRSSSHLAAPALDSSEDGEYEETYDETIWPNESREGTHINANSRQGLNPAQRRHLKDQVVPSLDEQQQQADLQAKNAEVTQWLSRSDASAPANAAPTIQTSLTIGKPAAPRRRAKSTGNRPELQADAFGLSRNLRAAQDATIPGPGLIVCEESEADDEDEDSVLYVHKTPTTSNGSNGRNEAVEPRPTVAFDEIAAQDAYPWIDPIYFPSQEGTVGQPGTSNEAIMRFAKRARDLETASRAATWGTNPRRLSDSDLQRVFGAGGLFSRLSVSRHMEREQDKENYKEDWRQLKEIVENRVLNLLPKRSNSTSRRKQSEPTRPSSKEYPQADSGRKESTHKRKESVQSNHDRKESLTSHFKRLPSVKRPKSPMLDTSAAIQAPGVSSSQASGVQNRGQSVASPTESHSPTLKHGVFRHAREMLSRHSSREASEPSLTSLWTQSGGPPLPNISSPPIGKDTLPEEEENDNGKLPHAAVDSNEVAGESTVKMDLSPRQDMIIPTFDGFKMNVRDVNPRLPFYLVERLGQEQLRRYKKLVEFKVKHAQAVQLDKCDSGSHCIEKGGLPTYFPAKTAQKEPELSHTGFTTAGIGEVDDDEDAVADGVVSEAQFPPGVPMPPVKRLPAEFECPLCFTVKKFTKPSDWSKHVHEDLQPFTCTFQTCADPKSFKRKADWVRHENERHRQLEWWQCTEEGCAHQCYRRDNFVQHLVREHKMPEPKAKTVKPDNKPAVRGPAKTKGRGNKDFAPEDKVLMMVEQCRHETTKNPIHEPCKFCGNVCNTFKKLTVHLARHMEQISMPVLELVKVKDVSPDTIISPIEARLAQTTMSPGAHSPYRNSVSVSPFEQPLEVSSAMQEHAAVFAPVQLGSTYQQPHFGHVVPWNSTTGANSTIPAQTASAYDASLANGWIHGNAAYSGNSSSAFQSMNLAPGAFPEQQVATGSGAYHRVDQPMAHGLSIPYQENSGYSVGLGQTPQFHIPQFVDGSSMPVGATENGVHLPYGVKEQRDYDQDHTGDQGLYRGQAVHQPSHQQQQYYSSY
ncbi:hypothetical protein MMC10_008998 [Thelotrema lepadinum]|nr:hypothetical protein [Thelotrema lepadinum]